MNGHFPFFVCLLIFLVFGTEQFPIRERRGGTLSGAVESWRQGIEVERQSVLVWNLLCLWSATLNESIWEKKTNNHGLTQKIKETKILSEISWWVFLNNNDTPTTQLFSIIFKKSWSLLIFNLSHKLLNKLNSERDSHTRRMNGCRQPIDIFFFLSSHVTHLIDFKLCWNSSKSLTHNFISNFILLFFEFIVFSLIFFFLFCITKWFHIWMDIKQELLNFTHDRLTYFFTFLVPSVEK